MGLVGLSGDEAVTAGMINSLVSDLLARAGLFLQWHCLQVNWNTSSGWHQDFLNFGSTAVWAFGDFTGGNLLVWGGAEVEVQAKDRLVIFDAKEFHVVQGYSGERFAVVLYQSPFRDDMDRKLAGRLKAAGFVTDERP